jgi:hypothetical protein
MKRNKWDALLEHEKIEIINMCENMCVPVLFVRECYNKDRFLYVRKPHDVFISKQTHKWKLIEKEANKKGLVIDNYLMDFLIQNVKL